MQVSKCLRRSTSKTITITSSDSANPTHIITLKANIVREIFAEPNYFAIAGIEPGKSGTSSVILRNNGSTPVKLDPPKLVGSTLMKVDFDMTEPTTIGAGDSLALSATVTPLNNAPEPVTYSLATDNPKNKEVRVTVNVSTAPVLN